MPAEQYTAQSTRSLVFWARNVNVNEEVKWRGPVHVCMHTVSHTHVHCDDVGTHTKDYCMTLGLSR